MFLGIFFDFIDSGKRGTDFLIGRLVHYFFLINDFQFIELVGIVVNEAE